MPTTTTRTKRSAPVRSARTDGQATRQLLLETAGRLFAQRGFAAVTSKEITEHAGVPAASVNYHFGSREALYEAVLVEAHNHMIDLNKLAAATASITDPKEKMRELLSQLLRVALGTSAPWGFQVMLREAMSPSPALPAIAQKAIRPKAEFFKSLVGGALGLPPDHPTVQRGVMLTILPCLVAILAPKGALKTLLPDALRHEQDFIDDFMTYALAGLDAIAVETSKGAKAPRRRSSRVS
ncbi:MAG TPA: TetR/AcrR family transcriptional regulator [Luteibacter sp.]|nr:TetR/AcrR family transcriptional regulator [Luteibacter sp.]